MEEEDCNCIPSSTTSTQVLNITQDVQRTECYISKRNFQLSRSSYCIRKTIEIMGWRKYQQIIR